MNIIRNNNYKKVCKVYPEEKTISPAKKITESPIEIPAEIHENVIDEEENTYKIRRPEKFEERRQRRLKREIRREQENNT